MPLTGKLFRVAFLTAVISALCVVGASAASLGIGTVTEGGLRLREETSVDSKILDVAPEGAYVIVLENACDGWYKVDFDYTVGYMSSDYVDVATTADIKIGYGMVQADGNTLNVRSGPGTSYDWVTGLEDGTIVNIVGINNGWYKIERNNVTGYVLSDYMVTCKTAPASRSSSSSSGSSSSSHQYVADNPVPAASSPIGQQVADYALRFLGVPYVWGGNGPNSFDCSGFTKYVYSHFGYTLNRTASAQLNNGVSVSRSNLEPGDLIFFYNGKVSTPVSHVGIYLGGGRFVHASTNSYAVQIDSLSGYYSNIYVYARRIF